MSKKVKILIFVTVSMLFFSVNAQIKDSVDAVEQGGQINISYWVDFSNVSSSYSDSLFIQVGSQEDSADLKVFEAGINRVNNPCTPNAELRFDTVLMGKDVHCFNTDIDKEKVKFAFDAPVGIAEFYVKIFRRHSKINNGESSTSYSFFLEKE